MFSFARLSPVLLSLVLLMPASVVFAEDDEPPVLRGEDAARANQPIDPVQVEKMAAEVRQVPLSEDMVDRFIASFKEMRDVAKKFPELPNSIIDEAPGSSPEKREAMMKVATANGFKDLDEWSVVGASIAMSYTYDLQGKKPGEVAKASNMHIAEVKEDQKLSAEQKESQIAQLQDCGKKLGRLEPMPQNYELVEQMKAKVAPIMNFE